MKIIVCCFCFYFVAPCSVVTRSVHENNAECLSVCVCGCLCECVCGGREIIKEGQGGNGIILFVVILLHFPSNTPNNK